MNKIHTEAKNLYRRLKGNINIPGLIKYIESKGYSVVFFNTEDGDELLTTYDLDPKNAKAFTYCGITKIVFVDGTMHVSDKIYSLLHECGHILLGHVGNNIIELLDRRLTENEAEVFAYAVLNGHEIIKRKRQEFVKTIALYILLLAGTYYFGQAYGDITPFVAVLMGGVIAASVKIKEREKRGQADE